MNGLTVTETPTVRFQDKVEAAVKSAFDFACDGKMMAFYRAGCNAGRWSSYTECLRTLMTEAIARAEGE